MTQNYENRYDQDARQQEERVDEDRRQRRHEYECRTFGTEIPTLGISIPALPPDWRPDPGKIEELRLSPTGHVPIGTSGSEAESQP